MLYHIQPKATTQIIKIYINNGMLKGCTNLKKQLYSYRSPTDLFVICLKVLSRGRIVKTGSVTSQNKMVQAFSLTMDASMAPTARIVVYYVRADGEIVTDSISFNVDGAFLNKVHVPKGVQTTSFQHVQS